MLRKLFFLLVLLAVCVPVYAQRRGDHFVKHLDVSTGANFNAAGTIGTHNRKPILTLSFDDSTESQYNNVLPLLNQYRIPATFFISQLWGQATLYGENHMSEAEAIDLCTNYPLIDCQSHGAEEDAAESNCASTGNAGETPASKCNNLYDDWKTQMTWFNTNLGRYPEAFAPPGADWSFYHGVVSTMWFKAVRAGAATKTQVDAGLHGGTRDGAPRFYTSTYFPQVENGAADICNYIKGGLAQDPGGLMSLSFHRIDDACTGSVDSNCYMEDDFTAILDCVATLRNAGKIDVLPFLEAVDAHRTDQRWNMLTNSCFQSPINSATAASGWTFYVATGGSYAFAADDDGFEGCRQLELEQPEQSGPLATTYVHDLVPGEAYVFAVDVQWETTGATRGVQLRVVNEQNLGMGDPTDDNPQNRGYFYGSNWEIGPGAADDRHIVYTAFIAQAPSQHLQIYIQGNTAPNDVETWVFRRPRLFKMETIGGNGNNPAAVQNDQGFGLSTFRLEKTGIEVGENASVVTDLKVLNSMNPDNSTPSPAVPYSNAYGPGPSNFLITYVEIVRTAGDGTPDYDWWLSGTNDQTATNLTKYCGEDTITGASYYWPSVDGASQDDRTWGTFGSARGVGSMCYVQDNDSMEEYWNTTVPPSAPAALDSGNELHFVIYNDDDSGVTTESFNIVIEGIVIR